MLVRPDSILVALLALTFASCDSPGGVAESQPVTASGPSFEQTRTEELGARLDVAEFDLVADGVRQGPALPVADVVAAVDKYAGKGQIRVEGEIAAVCQKRGCWMRLETGDEDLLVKFGDCDRYVPTDAAGRTALVEGELVVEVVSVEERRHMLEDAGDTEAAAAVAEPSRRLRLNASGAAIRR
ncbi:MAG: DUF4920 domain-containing protein [Planctomycetota bacterium]